jgi:hypothetical protein
MSTSDTEMRRRRGVAADAPHGSASGSAEARGSRLRVRDDGIVLDIPPPPLGRLGTVRVAAMVLAGIAAVYSATWLPGGFMGGTAQLAVGAGGAVLVGLGAFCLLRSLLGASTVVVTAGWIEVAHEFPLHSAGRIERAEFLGVQVGRHARIRRGFASGARVGRADELVLAGVGRTLHFGAGLPASELARLKQTIEEHLPPNAPAAADSAPDAEDVQPPERFWRDITRYAAGGFAGTLVLLVFLLALGAGGPLMGSVLVLALFLATATGLSYRSYGLEQTGCAWHRAVVKYEAALMDLQFSPGDPAGLARRLPDFRFFGGPRRLYNVAWSEADPNKIAIFDYTSSRRSPMRDGMACAVAINKLSHEALDMTPRLWPALSAPLTGMRLPEHPAMERRYRVDADNAGRARVLLSPAVVDSIMAWPGPAPHVSIRGGMVGLSMGRRHADSEKAIRHFYKYALAIREALLGRLRELRA